MSRKLAVLLDACSLPAFPIPMFGTLGISILLPEPRCVRLWTFLDSIVQLRQTTVAKVDALAMDVGRFAHGAVDVTATAISRRSDALLE